MYIFTSEVNFFHRNFWQTFSYRSGENHQKLQKFDPEICATWYLLSLKQTFYFLYADTVLLANQKLQQHKANACRA